MFKTLKILYALNFWEIECTPNRRRSFPHWLASMARPPGVVSLRPLQPGPECGHWQPAEAASDSDDPSLWQWILANVQHRTSGPVGTLDIVKYKCIFSYCT